MAARAGRGQSGGTAQAWRLSAAAAWPLRLKLLLGLLLLAALLGGSAALNPWRDLAVEVLALALLVFVAWTGRGEARGGRVAPIALACLVTVPLLQLVPLPSAVWTALPGRSFAAEIAGAVAPGAWYPLTFDRPATLQWLIALAVPVAAFLLARGTRKGQEWPVLWAIVALGCLSALLGLLQLAAGGLHLYVSAHNNFPVGLFANRNHQAAMMAITTTITLLLAVRRLRDGSSAELLWPYLPIVLLAATVGLLTQSRAGVALLGIGVVPALLMLRRSVPPRIALAGGAVIVAAALWLLFTGSGQGAFARLARTGGDERFVSWTDVRFMVAHHFPVGTGLSTFVRAFMPVESLTTVSWAYLNHAHCDYLELLAEAGVFGAAMIVAALVFVLLAVRRIIALPPAQDRTFAEVAAVTVLILLLVHSLVDYPARPFAIGAIAGAMAGLLARRLAQSAPAAGEATAPSGPVFGIGVSVLALAAAVEAARLALSTVVVAAATPAAPASLLLGSDAWAMAARNALAAGDLARAERSALTALRASTYNSSALQTLGEIAEGRNAATTYRLLNLAARVSWRNSDVQWWSLRQSLSDGNLGAAVDAGDALLRREKYSPEVLAVFIAMANTGPARAVLAQRLAEDPPWSDTLLRTIVRPDLQRTGDALSLLTDAMKRGYRPDDAPLLAFFSAAMAQGQGAGVLALTRIANRGTGLDPASGPVDPDFSRIAADQVPWGPFGWRMGDGAAYFDEAAQGSAKPRTLHVGRTASGDVLSQRLLLKPGAYTLHFAGGMADPGSGAARWTLKCAVSKALIMKASIDGPRDGDTVARLNVPADCLAQVLTLEVLLDTGDVNLDLARISIKPS